MRFAANPDWFLGKPKIAELVYKIIPDQNTLATQLQTHELDLGWNLAASSYERVKSIAGSRTITPVIYTFDHVDFNLRKPRLRRRAGAARADLRASTGPRCWPSCATAWAS